MIICGTTLTQVNYNKHVISFVLASAVPVLVSQTQIGTLKLNTIEYDIFLTDNSECPKSFPVWSHLV